MYLLIGLIRFLAKATKDTDDYDGANKHNKKSHYFHPSSVIMYDYNMKKMEATLFIPIVFV